MYIKILTLMEAEFEQQKIITKQVNFKRAKKIKLLCNYFLNKIRSVGVMALKSV